MGQKNSLNKNKNNLIQLDNEFLFLEIKEKAKINENDIVIGIDFGTSGIACAYGFFKNENEPTPVYFNGQADKNKISTEIILDDDLNVIAFGNDCSSYDNLINEKNYHHFKIK